MQGELISPQSIVLPGMSWKLLLKAAQRKRCCSAPGPLRETSSAVKREKKENKPIEDALVFEELWGGIQGTNSRIGMNGLEVRLCWSFVFTPGKNERPKISKMCRLQQQHETQLLSSSGLIFSPKKSGVCVAMKGEEHPHVPKNCAFCCPLLLSSVVTISEKPRPICWGILGHSMSWMYTCVHLALAFSGMETQQWTCIQRAANNYSLCQLHLPRSLNWGVFLEEDLLQYTSICALQHKTKCLWALTLVCDDIRKDAVSLGVITECHGLRERLAQRDETWKKYKFHSNHSFSLFLVPFHSWSTLSTWSWLVPLLGFPLLLFSSSTCGLRSHPSKAEHCALYLWSV